MGNVFEKRLWMSKCDMIEEYEMLVNLAHVSHMRHNWHAKLPRQQAHGYELTHSSQVRAIGL
jgi:hypothetical protein